MRPIDADAFKARMYHETFEKDSLDQRWDSGCWIRYRLFEKVLREAPTVEPEPKTGKWLSWKAYYGKDRKSWEEAWKCSACGYQWGDEEYNFCPICGAKMEGVEDD